MIDRKAAEKYLKEKCMKVIIDQPACEKLYNYCLKEYNLPKALTSDYISFRKSMAEANPFILYILFQGVIESAGIANNVKERYFTKRELEMFSSMKYEDDKIKFPLVFFMSQVAEDQWIGVIDTKTLMGLRKAQKINYEEATQRTKRKIQRGENVYYEISLNAHSVKSIRKSLASGQYIPDDITLNIPYDKEFDFEYDKDTHRMIIHSIGAFDMIDGYHRYVAICQASDLDDKFEYPMEFRLTNFDETKAKNFIYQKDQKTKMSKVDSASFNTNDLANLVVERLNTSPQSNLKGMISRNEGLINYGEFANIISYYYFSGNKIPKAKERIEVIRVANELMNKFNEFTSFNLDFLEKRTGFFELAAIVHCMKMSENYTKDTEKHINYLLGILENTSIKGAKSMRKSLCNIFDNYLKEVL